MSYQPTNTKRIIFLWLFWGSLVIHILLPFLVFGFDFSSLNLELIFSSYLFPLWFIIFMYLLLSILIITGIDIPLLLKFKRFLKNHTCLPKSFFILIFVCSWFFLPGVFNVVNTFWVNFVIEFSQKNMGLIDYISTQFPKIVSILIWQLIIFYVLSLIIYFGFKRKLALVPFNDLGTRQKAIISILATFFVIFAFVLLSPHFPGSGTVYFAGVTAVVSLIFTWSASAAIADFIAGIILIFFADLEEGDWVKIGNITGKIQEQNLLIHQIKTTKNTIVTIPNGDVLKNIITNYTPSKKSNKIDNPQIIYTTVTLGYDVKQKDAIDVLINAAGLTKGLITKQEAKTFRQESNFQLTQNNLNNHEYQDEIEGKESLPFEPFVLVTSLDDFYVSYELNAYLNPLKIPDDPGEIPKIYSRLHKNIQQECLKGEIEVLSPHYNAQRNGNYPAVPYDKLEDFSQAQNKYKEEDSQAKNESKEEELPTPDDITEMGSKAKEGVGKSGQTHTQKSRDTDK